MAALLLITVGILNFAYVELAPRPETDNHVSSYLNENNQKLEIPIFTNRFRTLEENEQLWGTLVNGSIYDENDTTDYDSRPIIIRRPKESPKTVETQTDVKLQKRFTAKKTIPSIPNTRRSGAECNNPNSCDVARIKCCLDKSNAIMCSNAIECAKIKNTIDLCESTALTTALKEVMKFL